MAEEQKWQEATNHLFCANKCGFFGSPTTLNLCSKCYKDHCLKEQHISTAKIAVKNSFNHQSKTPESVTSFSSSSSASVQVPVSVFSDPSVSDLTVPSTAVKPEQRNRCESCRKRVGLTGFTCRCGTVFCGVHRYPEKYECSFDFKSVGKEVL